MSYLIKIDSFLDSLKNGKNAAVDSWLLMSSPVPLMVILTTYLLFVTRLGPAIMRKRPPMKLTKIMICYNAMQVVLSAIVCYKCYRLNLFSDGILFAGCSYPGTTQDMKLSNCGWWYFFAKVTELLDTVFFVLRKKDRQISFLHVYHHSVMAVFSWSYLKFAAGGQGAVLGGMNSLVHVVMYSYYLLAALGPAIEKYLWWKKYVTTMQMIQFVLMVAYCVITSFLPGCNFPKSFTYFISTNIIIFFALFLKFYVQSYKKNSKFTKQVKDTFENKNGNINVDENGKSGSEFMNGNIEHISNGKIIDQANNAPLEVDLLCGDYAKSGRVFMTKRTAKTVYGAQYDHVFDSKVK